MKQYTVIEATFAPQKTDDLQNDAAACIGKRYLWLVSGVVEEGPYTGQTRLDCYAMEAGDDRKFCWAPLCDVCDVVEVER